MPVIRTNTYFIGKDNRIVILDSTRSFICEVDVPEASSAVVSVSNSVDSTNREEVIRTVGHKGLLVVG